MTRTIKFRAWDKRHNKMTANPEMYVNSTDKNPEGGLYFSLNDLFEQETERDIFEYMQFTGLLDKNGVEIYEGDILAHYHANTWEGRPNGSYTRKKVVEWVTSGTKCGFNIAVSKKYEVIGNIYETTI